MKQREKVKAYMGWPGIGSVGKRKIVVWRRGRFGVGDL